MSSTLPPDPYNALGVGKSVTVPELRAAFLKLVIKYHPNKFTDEAVKAEKFEEFKKIQDAYEILSDESRKLRYDEQAKLLELRKKTGRGYPGLRSNYFEHEVGESNPRVSSGRQSFEYEAQYANPINGELLEPLSFGYDDRDREQEMQSFTRNQDKERVKIQESSMLIEEGIKARNARAYQNLRQGTLVGKSATDPLLNPELDADINSSNAKVILTTVPPDQLGMTVMNPRTTKTSVDIIAVHGLGAIPEITWKEKHSGRNWLADSEMLPKAVPEARIMRFGYDSLWLGKEAIRTRLSTIANKLLLVLKREREALIIAKLLEASFPGILKSSVGVIFLGTPHRGTKSFLPQSALLASIAAQSDLHGRIEPGVLDTMRSDSGATLDVAEDFADLCRDLQLEITCFFEERKSRLGKVIGRTDIEEFMVPEESATFDGHPRYGLPLDHFNLNKFPSPDNGNFKDVCGEVVRLYGIVQKNLSVGNSNAYHQMKIGPKSLQKGRRTLSLKKSFIEQEEEAGLIKKATEELDREDFEKKYQERKATEAEEKAKENKEAESQYKSRLITNMKKYDILNPEEIVNLNPLPDDNRLKPQEVKDKMRWYKNRVKVALLNHGVPGGQVDEILNDTGDTMVIDGVKMTYTKMALKWISTRTLTRYNVPYKIDENDPSVVIIKRWVPDYEQEFLWDHTYQLRNRGRERGATVERNSTKHSAQPSSKNNRADNAPVIRSRSKSYDSVRGGYDPISSKGRNRSDSFSEKNRQKSYDSVTSAPDTEDIARRRRHSRTLSIERPQERPHKQKSYDSVQSPRESNTKEYNWSSDGETTGMRTSKLFSGIRKSFGRSTASSSLISPKNYVKHSKSEEDERRSQTRRRVSRLKKEVESDSGESGSELEMNMRKNGSKRVVQG